MRLNRETVDKVRCAAAVIGTGKVAALVDIVYCIIAPSALDKSLTLTFSIML